MDAVRFLFLYHLFHKNSLPCTHDLNKALAELKKNGEYDKLYSKWFGAKK